MQPHQGYRPPPDSQYGIYGHPSSPIGASNGGYGGGFGGPPPPQQHQYGARPNLHIQAQTPYYGSSPPSPYGGPPPPHGHSTHQHQQHPGARGGKLKTCMLNSQTITPSVPHFNQTHPPHPTHQSHSSPTFSIPSSSQPESAGTVLPLPAPFPSVFIQHQQR
jgi:hypothetical protein